MYLYITEETYRVGQNNYKQGDRIQRTMDVPFFLSVKNHVVVLKAAPYIVNDAISILSFGPLRSAEIFLEIRKYHSLDPCILNRFLIFGTHLDL